jgi:TfoX/Sxy family transcriptional regulator of competence genes
MAYDEQLAARIGEVLADVDGISEQKMFGGLALLQHGNMVCGVMGETLMLRLGPELADAALDEPHTRPMTFTGRPMKSMVIVEPPGFTTDDALTGWVERALAFVATLPPKRRSDHSAPPAPSPRDRASRGRAV